MKKIDKVAADFQDYMGGRAVRALQKTWDAIASDCMQCEDRSRISGAGVRAWVSNAGFVGGYPETYGGDHEAVAWLEGQSRAAQEKLLKRAFPERWYS